MRTLLLATIVSFPLAALAGDPPMKGTIHGKPFTATKAFVVAMGDKSKVVVYGAGSPSCTDAASAAPKGAAVSFVVPWSAKSNRIGQVAAEDFAFLDTNGAAAEKDKDTTWVTIGNMDYSATPALPAVQVSAVGAAHSKLSGQIGVTICK
jgi:hypothetical protein